ncbi:MAG TPA: V-type ATPase 116kDa subunit family protein [Candidatus Dormibacteraeota bacterium]|nr:V-type ATPase 116kDa subunit family protein [Candidatus Dormibacteraeota bacterium]
MQQVSIIVAKDQLPNLLGYAGSKRLFHLTEIENDSIPEGAKRYEALELQAKSSTIRSRLTTLTTALKVSEATFENLDAPVNNIEALTRFLDEETGKLEHSVRELEGAEGKLQTEKEQASELSRFLSGLENVGVSLDAIAGRGFLTSLVGEASLETTPILQKDLDRITQGNLIFALTNTSEETQTFLAIFPAAFQDDAKQVTTALGAKLGPPWTGLPSDPRKAKEAIDLQLANLEKESKNLEETRARIAKEYAPRIKALAILSEILDARTKALGGSSSTESTVLFQAWIPKTQVESVAADLSKATSGLASIYAEDTKSRPHNSAEESASNKDLQPPTLVKTPGWTRPLQSIVDNFGIPSYSETNPTPFMILTFPLIYGLMFGDIGEGLLFLAFGFFLLYLKRKKVKVFEIGQIFVNGAELVIMLGIGVTIFGFVFGDFFGFETRAIFSPIGGAFHNPPDISNLLLYMEFILFFGVAHYLSGLCISAYNKIQNREYRHALLGPIAWAWFYASFIYAAVLVVESNFKFSVLLSNPLVVASVFVPLLLMGYGEGGLHVMEAFIGAGSNTLSYLRIWALNLADFAVKFAFFTSFGVGGAILGNALVMILEGLIVFVQTLRLHWVEWFGKFYEGTGHSFTPYAEPQAAPSLRPVI